MTPEKIKRDLEKGELSTLDAIEALEQLGYTPRAAEAIVDTWTDDPNEKQTYPPPSPLP